MILVPAGSFWMGSEGHYAWESPRHHVYVDDFSIAESAVTRRDFQKFLEASGHEKPRGWDDPAFGAEDHPIVGVNWFDAMDYCAWFSNLHGEAYRLPTEAEWEKACRGGLEDADYAWGNESPESIDYFRGNWSAPRAVGQWKPNGYGIHNIGDNVHEWCSDWYAPDYYAKSPEHNPDGPQSGTRRVSRGGSWRHRIKASRAAHRSSLPPAYRYTDYGFRVVRSGRDGFQA